MILQVPSNPKHAMITLKQEDRLCFIYLFIYFTDVHNFLFGFVDHSAMTAGK